jgi:hypothetical protein
MGNALVARLFYSLRRNGVPVWLNASLQELTVAAGRVCGKKGSMYLDRVQGGVFTHGGRIILSRTDPNGIHCYSALNGHYFGGRELSEVDSEGEGVTIRAWNFGALQASVHVIEQDIDAEPSDFYLHSYGVPDPARL